jgi:hypothetical protein
MCESAEMTLRGTIGQSSCCHSCVPLKPAARQSQGRRFMARTAIFSHTAPLFHAREKPLPQPPAFSLLPQSVIKSKNGCVDRA